MKLTFEQLYNQPDMVAFRQYCKASNIKMSDAKSLSSFIEDYSSNDVNGIPIYDFKPHYEDLNGERMSVIDGDRFLQESNNHDRLVNRYDSPYTYWELVDVIWTYRYKFYGIKKI